MPYQKTKEEQPPFCVVCEAEARHEDTIVTHTCGKETPMNSRGWERDVEILTTPLEDESFDGRDLIIFKEKMIRFIDSLLLSRNEALIKSLEEEIQKPHQLDSEKWGWDLIENLGQCCPGDDATTVYKHSLRLAISIIKGSNIK